MRSPYEVSFLGILDKFLPLSWTVDPTSFSVLYLICLITPWWSSFQITIFDLNFVGCIWAWWGELMSSNKGVGHDHLNHLFISSLAKASISKPFVTDYPCDWSVCGLLNCPSTNCTVDWVVACLVGTSSISLHSFEKQVLYLKNFEIKWDSAQQIGSPLK